MFLGKAWGEHESHVDNLFKLRTLGIESAPSCQTDPKNLFFQQSNIPVAVTEQALLYCLPRHIGAAAQGMPAWQGQGTAWRAPGQFSPV